MNVTFPVNEHEGTQAETDRRPQYQWVAARVESVGERFVEGGIPGGL